MKKHSGITIVRGNLPKRTKRKLEDAFEKGWLGKIASCDGAVIYFHKGAEEQAERMKC